jgi:hypothetical protein
MCLGTVNLYLTLGWRLMLVVYVQIPNKPQKFLYFIVDITVIKSLFVCKCKQNEKSAHKSSRSMFISN